MVLTKAGRRADKVAKGTVTDVELTGKKIVIFNLNDTFYAIVGKYAHMGCSLSSDNIEGERVICACHGSTFDLKTGEVVRGPAVTPEPSCKVKVENGELLVDL